MNRGLPQWPRTVGAARPRVPAQRPWMGAAARPPVPAGRARAPRMDLTDDQIKTMLQMLRAMQSLRKARQDWGMQRAAGMGRRMQRQGWPR